VVIRDEARHQLEPTVHHEDGDQVSPLARALVSAAG
jgi:hypothetical protein